MFLHTTFPSQKKQPAKAITKKKLKGWTQRCEPRIWSNGQNEHRGGHKVETKKNTLFNNYKEQQTKSSESLYFARCEPLLVLKLVIFGDFLPWEFERHEVLRSSWEDEEPPLFHCFLDFNQVRVLSCIRSFVFIDADCFNKETKPKKDSKTRAFCLGMFHLQPERWKMVDDGWVILGGPDWCWENTRVKG